MNTDQTGIWKEKLQHILKIILWELGILGQENFSLANTLSGYFWTLNSDSEKAIKGTIKRRPIKTSQQSVFKSEACRYTLQSYQVKSDSSSNKTKKLLCHMKLEGCGYKYITYLLSFCIF